MASVGNRTISQPQGRTPQQERDEAVGAVRKDAALGVAMALTSLACGYATKEVWDVTFGISSIAALPPAALTFMAGAYGLDRIEMAIRGAMRLPPRVGAPLAPDESAS